MPASLALLPLLPQKSQRCIDRWDQIFLNQISGDHHHRRRAAAAAAATRATLKLSYRFDR